MYAFRAAVSGSVDTASASGPYSIAGRAQGAKTKLVLANAPKLEATMTVQGNIETVQDLEGKRIGIHEPGVIVLLFAIFPILINTYQGVKNVDPGLLEVAKSFNTTERRMWIDVLLPSAVPYIAARIRLAIGRALVGMVIAEFYTAISGLGYMVTRYAHIFRMDKTLVPEILLMVMGVTFSAALKFLEGRITPWNQAHKR